MSKLRGLVAVCASVLTVSVLLAGVCAGSAWAGGTVFFIDAQHGWESTCSGDLSDPSAARATAWSTVDGGASWKQLSSRPAAYNGAGTWGGFFAFATRSTGIWVRSSHTVLRTTNAGKSWRSVGWVVGKDMWPSDASFATSRVGWACGYYGSAGDGGSIAKTSNAGATWRIQKHILSARTACGQVSCPTALNCYVRGRQAGQEYLWATADGGKHWARRPLPVRGNFGWGGSIDFPTATTGWVVGSEGAMASTTDGGRTWQSVDSGTGEDLGSVSFCSPDVGYVVGASGTVLRTTDAGMTWVDVSIFPIDWYWGNPSTVTCVDATHTWIRGSYGHGDVYETSDGGLTWSFNSVYPSSPGGE